MIDKPAYSRPFGIVQGRLSVPPGDLLQWFPQDSWSEEFEKAKEVGLEFVELLAERQFNPDNPLWTTEGREQIRTVARKTGLHLYSSCIDYVIDYPLLDDPQRETEEHVRSFLAASGALGCRVVILPLLECSDLNTSTSTAMIPIIRDFARQAAKLNMLICIETLLEGKHLKAFLVQVNEPNVKCVFDTGNRVLEERNLRPEILLLGDWIGHVHIKDKNDFGANVLLGTGDVNFAEVFIALREIDYKGPLVFETTRGTNPVSTAIYNVTCCNFFTNEAHHG